MAKKLNNYKVIAAGSWTIVQAISPEMARAQMAKRLGVERKEWLWGGIKVVAATPEDVERYLEVTNVGARSKDGRNVVREKLDAD